MLDQQMKPANAGSRTALRASTVLTAAGIVLAGGPAAGQVQEEPRWKRPSDYSSAKDWNLKAENIVPHGLNPLYYPIVPGHKHAHERPDHPDGFYRKETVVLNDTEDGGISGRPPDALFLQSLHQSGLVVARRRFREVLLGNDLVQAQRLALVCGG